MKFIIPDKDSLKHKLVDVLCNHVDDETKSLLMTTTNIREDIEKHFMEILSAIFEVKQDV